MDKTLNRPLFRKRAQQLHSKVDPNQVPKFFVGGIMSVGNMIRAGAAPAYRYLAPKVSSFFARPGVQTGLVGLEAASIGTGTREMAEGIQEGDAGKFISGAAYAVPGMAYIPYSAKRSGIGAIRKVGEKLGDPTTSLGKAIFQRPKTTLAASIGTPLGYDYVMGDVTEATPEGMSQEEYIADVQDRLIYREQPEYKPDPKKKVTENLAEYEKMKESFQPRPIGIKNPRTEGEQTLNQQYKILDDIQNTAEKLGVDLTKANDEQIKQIAIETNVDEPTLRNMLGAGPKEVLPEMTGPGDTGGAGGEMPMNPIPNVTGNETPEQIDYLVEKRKRDLAAGKELTETNALTGEFRQFKDELDKMTGVDNKNLNNLLMMRTAASLLTGKSPERGVRGFLDVAGQALGTTADAMLGMKLKQQENDMQLAQAFLKMKQEKAKGVEMLTTGDKTVRVSDPSVPGGFRNVRVSLGKDNKYYERKITPEGQQYFTEATFTGTDVERNPDKLNAALMGLEENRRGGKMIDYVIDNSLKGGTKAAFGLLSEDVLGTLDFFAGGNLGADSSVIDDQIRAEMMKNTSREGIDFTTSPGSLVNVFRKESENMQDRFNKDLEKARENGAQEVEKQLKKAGIIAKNYRPTEADLRAYTKLALIEQRMKYIVANANKSEDRLTQKDIDNAAKRTQIIKYITSPRTIRLNYEQLRGEFNEKAGSYLNQYKLNGGDEQFIQDNFMDIPGVLSQYQTKNEEFMRRQNIQNQRSRQEILQSIPIG